MASSAHTISVQTGAAFHASHGKTSHKIANDPSGDSFADILEQSDAAAKDARAPSPQTEHQTEHNKAARAEKSAKAGQSSNKSNDKSDDKTVASDDKDAPEESGQADVDAPTEAVAKDTKPVTDDAKAADADDARENVAANDNALMDVAAALPQPAQPAPQVLAPATPVMAPQTAPQTDGADQDVQNIPDIQNVQGAQNIADDANAEAAETGIAPAAVTNPATVTDGADAQDENLTAATGKPADAMKAPPPRTTAGKKDAPVAGTDHLAKNLSQDFTKALQDGSAAPDAAQTTQKPAAEADIAKSAEVLPAAKPSPDINAIALTAPAASAPAPQGAEKPAVTARADTPALPQPAPNLNQMAVEVAARSQSGARQFDIRLDPPELGRVEVRLSIDAHGKAEAHLTADQPQTLDLLQKDAPALARALREAGLNVQQDGLNFSLKHQQQHAGGDDQSRQGGRAGFTAAKTQTETSPQDDGAYVRRSLGLLDIRV